MAVSRYKEFGIPVNWLQDSGVVGKLSSVQLARKYMKRVASELDALDGPEKEPNREFLVLQGVRFAFRVHQFVGGFDAESMKAFEELRNRMQTQASESKKSRSIDSQTCGEMFYLLKRYSVQPDIIVQLLLRKLLAPRGIFAELALQNNQVGLTLLLLIIYNFSDQVLHLREENKAKSREAAERSAKETSQLSWV